MPRSPRRTVPLAVAFAVAALALMAPGGGSVAPGPGPPRYLALKHSLAPGIQPGPGGHHRITSQGYAEHVWRHELGRYRGLVLAKLGRGGETAASMDRSRHGGPSQLALAERGGRLQHRPPRHVRAARPTGGSRLPWPACAGGAGVA